jgi:hypothetical protein
MSVAATAGGGAAAAAAAKRRRMLQDEEERMTSYNSQDMDGWEFKIVRAITNKFKNFETLKRVCAEEAKSGWEMVEKFDDQRIRFKRRIDRRSMDQHATIDPYRTTIGISEGQMVMLVLGIIALVGGIAALIAMR